MIGGEIVRLSRLVEGLPVLPAGDASALGEIEVTGITHDSRRVVPGDLFVAWSGERFDGRAFAEDAAGRGAVAMLGESCSGASLPCLSAEEPRRLLGPLASRLFDRPDRELTLVGVTGTNGKTTVVSLVAAILDAADRPAARFGTLGYGFRDLHFEGERTTPEASDLFRMLRVARDAGATSAVMEVSSHALEQGRVCCASFDVAVFLNLTRDHLDFHAEMGTYFEAKTRLFAQLKPGGVAVLNVDDPRGAELAARMPGATTFGDAGAVRFASLRAGVGGIEGAVTSPIGAIEIRSHLLGDYNALNLLAAAAVGVALGVETDRIAAGLASLRPLPGRMEAVDCGQPFPVVIDFAHTDGALRAALASMRSLDERGRILVVVGCGGQRDRGKRPLMGRAAAELADYAILTSDNPRGEDPAAILEAVEQGAREVGGARYEVIVDRREAIRRAMAIAGPGWSVLIAGKGHERWQEVGSSRIPFVDREEVAKALEVGFGTAPIE